MGLQVTQLLHGNSVCTKNTGCQTGSAEEPHPSPISPFLDSFRLDNDPDQDSS